MFLELEWTWVYRTCRLRYGSCTTPCGVCTNERLTAVCAEQQTARFSISTHSANSKLLECRSGPVRLDHTSQTALPSRNFYSQMARKCTCTGQCFFLSRNIGYVSTPKNNYFHYLEKVFSGSKYPKKRFIPFWKQKHCYRCRSTAWHRCL